jgi:tetratricopeptide (TPR) repeat protein
MDEGRRTVLHLLATRRGIRSHQAFSNEYTRVAGQLRTEGHDVSPAPAARQWERLLKFGDVKTAPYAPTSRVLERMFQRPVGDLLRSASDIQELEPDCSTRAPYPPVLDESDLLMTARDAASHASEAASLNLDEMTLDQLHDELIALSRKYGHTAPAEVFHGANELLNRSQVLLERTRFPEQQTRLYYAAAQASALLAAVSFDLGALAPAISFARSSAQYGKTIGHGPVQAYAYGMLAFMAFWDGRPNEAVRHAKVAHQFGGLGDTARRRLYSIEARAHGHLRNRDQAERAIRDALEQSSGRRDELHDDIGGEFAFDGARTAMSNATTCLLLRDAEGAEAYATRALTLLRAQSADEQPIVVAGPAAVDLARARLLRNEVEGAQEALVPVFKVPPNWRGSGMMERLTAARIELTRPDFRGAPAALALADQIEDFSALSPARRLGAANPLAIEA